MGRMFLSLLAASDVATQEFGFLLNARGTIWVFVARFSEAIAKGSLSHHVFFHFAKAYDFDKNSLVPGRRRLSDALIAKKSV